MRYVIVDLEATCWEGVRGSPDMEIIEIGALCLEGSGGPVVGEYNAFVKPIVVPRLSEFCQRLTSIRQEDVDGAESFYQVLDRFTTWIGAEPYFLCSWGAYDLNQLRQDCQRHGQMLPSAFEGHINLKKEFARLYRVKSCGMAKALKIAKLPLAGTHHRAIDDVRKHRQAGSADPAEPGSGAALDGPGRIGRQAPSSNLKEPPVDAATLAKSADPATGQRSAAPTRNAAEKDAKDPTDGGVKPANDFPAWQAEESVPPSLNTPDHR